MAYKCASFFAGVGGIDLGFEETGKFKTIYANEFDQFPAKTMALNFPGVTVDVRDIHQVSADDVPNVDVIMGGFPCQAFSIAGLRQGFNDEKGRGTLFFELLRIIEAKRPQAIVLENVKNLVSHDNGNTFRVIAQALENAGYHIKYKVLNAMEYGNTPQNRERIYIVGFRSEEAYRMFDFPEPVKLTRTVQDVIDFKHPVDDKYYYRPGKYKGELYEALDKAMDDPDAVYQWRRRYVRKNRSGVVPTLTANMGEGGHNVPIVRTETGIRKITPHECFNVQGFPEDFKLPTDVRDSRLYKQAGNSVCVSVLERIAENVANALQANMQSEIATDWIENYVAEHPDPGTAYVKKMLNSWKESQH